MGIAPTLVELHDLPDVKQRRVQITPSIHADPLGRIGESGVHSRAVGRCGFRRSNVGARGILDVLLSVLGSGLGILHRHGIFFLRGCRNLRHLGLLGRIRDGILRH